MNNFQETREYNVWVKLHCFAIFLFVPYSILRYLSVGHYGVFLNFYIHSIPILVAFYYFFRRGKDGAEVKLLLAFCIWLVLSRALNGDASLTHEVGTVRNMFVMLLSMTACMVLSAQKRLIFIDCISLVVCLFYTILAVVGIFGTLYQRTLLNPFSGTELISFYKSHRVCFLGLNPNTGAYWFFISFFLLIYLFFRTKKTYLRAAIIVSAVVNYLAIALTYCRNVMLGLSVGIAMLVILIVFNHISAEKKKIKVLAVILIICTVLPLTYSSFSLTTKVLGNISYSIISKGDSPDSADVSSVEGTTEQPSNINSDDKNTPTISFSDSRGFSSNGRIPLYRSFVETIKTYPLRLIKGCLSAEIMTISNSILPKPQTHFHNVFFQLLVYTGIPGLAIAITPPL